MAPALLALVAALGWGTGDFLAGHTSRSVSASVVLATSQGVGVVLTAAVVALASPGLPPTDLVVFAILSGVFLAIGLGSLYEGLRVGNMSVIAPISATAVVVPVVYGLLSGESVSPIQTAAILLALIGIVLASAERTAGHSVRLTAGIGFALLAAAAGGANLVFLNDASQHGVLWTLLLQRLTIVVLAGAVAALARTRPALPRSSFKPVAVIGTLDVIATGCFAAATTLGQLSLIAMIGGMYPVFTVLLAQALLHERLARLQLVGAAAALAAAAILVGSQRT